MDLTSALESKGLEESRAYILEQTRQQNGTGSSDAQRNHVEQVQQNGKHDRESPQDSTPDQWNSQKELSVHAETPSDAHTRSQTIHPESSPIIQEGTTNMTLVDSISVGADPSARGNCVCYDSGGNIIIRSLGNVVQIGRLDNINEQFQELGTCELPEENSIRHIETAKLPSQLFRSGSKFRFVDTQSDSTQIREVYGCYGSIVTAVTAGCLYLILVFFDAEAQASLEIIETFKQNDISLNSYEDQLFAEGESNGEESPMAPFQSVSCCWLETSGLLCLCIQQHPRINLLSINIMNKEIRYLRAIHTSSLERDFCVHCRSDRLEVVMCFSKEVHTVSWNPSSMSSFMHHRCLLTDSIDASDASVGDAVLCAPVNMQMKTYLLVITEAILDFSGVKESLRGPGQSLNMAINESRRHAGGNEAKEGAPELPASDTASPSMVRPQPANSGEDSALSKLMDIKGAEKKEDERYRCRDARALLIRLFSHEDSFLSIQSCVRLPAQVRHPKSVSMVGKQLIVGDTKNIASCFLRVSKSQPAFEKFTVSKLPDYCTLLGLGTGSENPPQLVIQTKKSTRSPLFGVNLNNPAEDDETSVFLWSLRMPRQDSTKTEEEEEEEEADKRNLPALSKDKKQSKAYTSVDAGDMSHLQQGEQLGLVHSLSSAASSKALAAEALCSACRSTSSEGMSEAINTAYQAVRESDSAWNEAKRLWDRCHKS